ncbi:MAG: S8 family serine peptidase [Pseudomonadota bacterium]
MNTKSPSVEGTWRDGFQYGGSHQDAVFAWAASDDYQKKKGALEAAIGEDAPSEDSADMALVAAAAPVVTRAAEAAAGTAAASRASGAVDLAALAAVARAGDGVIPGYAVFRDAAPANTTTALPTDDLFGNQWHLLNTGQSGGVAGVDLNVVDVWEDYTGEGVTVAVWDDGVQYTHPDLDGNYDESLHIVVNGQVHDPAPQIFLSEHGTAVAGVIAAENDGVGTVGVAYDATLVGVDMFFDFQLDFEASFYELDNFDVTNHSWGWIDPYFDSISDTSGSGGTDWESFFGGFFESVETGRGGLGTINLVANGNDRDIGRDGNDSGLNNIPQTIAVGATSHDGYVSWYSTPGANLLISSPSNGADGAGIYTTDRTGNQGYTNTNYTPEFGGTSSATPAAAGVVALMLEANDQLGWRDVQEILAYSARHTGSDIGAAPEADELYTWTFNGADNWNGGGLHFSNDYGFGLIDALSAVRLAETWTDQKTSANWETPVVATADVNTVIPNNDPNGISFTMEATTDFEIEHVGLTLTYDGGRTGDYTIVLVSPDGTRSTLAVSNTGDAATDDWFYMSNQFRGENGVGTWTVEIADERNGQTGTLMDAELQFFGESANTDDVFIYTDEFSAFAGDGNHETTLDDTDGGVNTLNAAAVTSDTTVVLGNGAIIDGVEVSSVTGISNVFTGDGDDRIRGDGGDNILSGGRGDDRISGGKGDDTLSDGDGKDILSGRAGADIYDLTIDAFNDVIRGFTDGVDLIQFAEGMLDFSDLMFTDLSAGRVLIEYDTDSVTVVDRTEELSAADFDAADFLFV